MSKIEVLRVPDERCVSLGNSIHLTFNKDGTVTIEDTLADDCHYWQEVSVEKPALLAALLEDAGAVQALYHNDGGCVVLDDVPIWMINGTEKGYVYILPIPEGGE